MFFFFIVFKFSLITNRFERRKRKEKRKDCRQEKQLILKHFLLSHLRVQFALIRRKKQVAKKENLFREVSNVRFTAAKVKKKLAKSEKERVHSTDLVLTSVKKRNSDHLSSFLLGLHDCTPSKRVESIKIARLSFSLSFTTILKKLLLCTL